MGRGKWLQFPVIAPKSMAMGIYKCLKICYNTHKAVRLQFPIGKELYYEYYE